MLEMLFENLSADEKLCVLTLYYPLSSGLVFEKNLAWYLCQEILKFNRERWDDIFSKLVVFDWIQRNGDTGYIYNKNCIVQVISTDNMENFEEMSWMRYYMFWVEECKRIDALLDSKDQLLGCSDFDKCSHHLNIIFDSLGNGIVKRRLNNPESIKICCGLADSISNILKVKYIPSKAVSIDRSILSILCDGNDSGIMKDDRYWKLDSSRRVPILAVISRIGFNLTELLKQPYVAEPMVKEAMKFASKSDGRVYDRLLNSVGIVYDSLGKESEALAMYQRTLSVRLELLGEMHADTAGCYNNIGRLYDMQKKYNKALEMYEISLRIRLQVLGEKHASTAGSYNNIAVVYKGLLQLEKALEMYRMSLAIREEVLGENHINTASSFYNIGTILKDLGRYEEALGMHQKGLDIKIKILGEKHLSTADSYNNMAIVCKCLSQHSKALELYEKTLKTRLELCGEKDSSTGDVYYNMALNYVDMNKILDAKIAFQNAKKSYTYAYGENHEYVLDATNQIARLKPGM